jgi:hypothetical protein
VIAGAIREMRSLERGRGPEGDVGTDVCHT